MESSTEKHHQALRDIAYTELSIAFEKERRAHQETKAELEALKELVRDLIENAKKIDLEPAKKDGKVWGKI